ncbi:GrdX family protein [Desulfovibrio sp. OttesenSCG-928-G11]|nr:GrdX family protein [Desulfovibrio sp. OttesenSCG-928-G11]
MSVMLFSNNPRMRAFLPKGCVDALPAQEEQGAQTKPNEAGALDEQDAVCLAASAQVPSSPAAPLLVCRFSTGPALPVLLGARDKIHLGWKLLNHPLYGNFRPHQQPYRSLLLRPCAKAAPGPDKITRAAPDPLSLHLLEQALELYNSVSVLDPARAPAALRDACAILDCELMRLPLQQAGLAPDSLGALA